MTINGCISKEHGDKRCMWCSAVPDSDQCLSIMVARNAVSYEDKDVVIS